MNEENKIIDLLEFEGFFQSIQELLSNQTKDILLAINELNIRTNTEEFENLKIQLAAAKVENHKILTSLAYIEKRLDDEIEEKNNVLNELAVFKSRYELIDKAYSTFFNLSEECIVRLKNVCHDDNVYSFICAISDWNNIESIWQFTKRRIIENDMGNADQLVQFFIYCFELFCVFNDNKTLELISPKIGDRFDSDKQSILGIETDGDIKKVILNGVFDKNKNRVVFKAIVCVH